MPLAPPSVDGDIQICFISNKYEGFRSCYFHCPWSRHSKAIDELFNPSLSLSSSCAIASSPLWIHSFHFVHQRYKNNASAECVIKKEIDANYFTHWHSSFNVAELMHADVLHIIHLKNKNYTNDIDYIDVLWDRGENKWELVFVNGIELLTFGGNGFLL